MGRCTWQRRAVLGHADTTVPGTAVKSFTAIPVLLVIYVLATPGARIARADDAAGAAATAAAARLAEANALALALAGDPAAEAAYREAAAQADAAGDRLVAARARTNAARLALGAGRAADARRLLGAALRDLAAPLASRDEILTAVSAGRLLARLGVRDASARSEAFLALARAADAAAAQGEPALGGWAAATIGELYTLEGRPAEGLEMLGRALGPAQASGDAVLLAHVEGERGRALARLGREDDAIAALRRATRAPAAGADPALAWHADLAEGSEDAPLPPALVLVDLLLRRAAAAGGAPPPGMPGAAAPPAGEQALLREARDTLERHRTNELRDYLRDDCVEQLERTARPVEEVAADAAVLHAVVLPDRTELLLGLASGLRRFRVDVSAATLREETRTLRRLLEKRTTREYLPLARRLYDRLVRPLEPLLAEAGTSTIVVVPGGPLRTIPLAALHDGERFLVERFGFASAPGLTITDPRPFPHDGAKALVAGISAASPGGPALPEVPGEVAAVHEVWGGTTLLDAEFTPARAEAALAAERFRVVHVASHAEITADPRRSLLWTHDGALPLDRVASWIGVARHRAEPVELLVLSACSTAAGDERAALGLAGVAVHAGARSAVGTLWKVPDASAAELVVAFHRALHEPGVSRAEALRRAQRALLARPDTAHPAHWAAFLLVSAWL